MRLPLFLRNHVIPWFPVLFSKSRYPLRDIMFRRSFAISLLFFFCSRRFFFFFFFLFFFFFFFFAVVFFFFLPLLSFVICLFVCLQAMKNLPIFNRWLKSPTTAWQCQHHIHHKSRWRRLPPYYFDSGKLFWLHCRSHSIKLCLFSKLR